MLVKFRHGAEATISAVIYEFAINFVGNESDVMFQNKTSNHLHFFFGVNYASRVTGVGEQDCSGTRSDFCFDFFFAGQMVTIFYISLNCIDNSTEFFSESGVVCIVRFKYHNFIARIAESHCCEDEGFTTTIGDEDIF